MEVSKICDFATLADRSCFTSGSISAGIIIASKIDVHTNFYALPMERSIHNMKWKLILLATIMSISQLGLARAASVVVHTIQTPYQAAAREVRVLMPDDYDENKRYRVLYLLPVEKRFERKSGYALGLFQEMDVPNSHDLIVVQMEFEKEPWFGDHATDRRVQQATYLKDYVVPFIENKYSTLGTPEGRLLFGFSKSGWGAFSLILRYPDYFGYAAAWDAPLLLNRFHFRMKEVFGTLKQLDQHRPDLLVAKQREFFQEKTRLVLTGEKAWGKTIPTPSGGSHTEEAHLILRREKVNHIFDGTLRVPHRWDRKWIAPTLQALMQLVTQNSIPADEQKSQPRHFFESNPALSAHRIDTRN